MKDEERRGKETRERKKDTRKERKIDTQRKREKRIKPKQKIQKKREKERKKSEKQGKGKNGSKKKYINQIPRSLCIIRTFLSSVSKVRTLIIHLRAPEQTHKDKIHED